MRACVNYRALPGGGGMRDDSKTACIEPDHTESMPEDDRGELYAPLLSTS